MKKTERDTLDQQIMDNITELLRWGDVWERRKLKQVVRACTTWHRIRKRGLEVEPFYDREGFLMGVIIKGKKRNRTARADIFVLRGKNPRGMAARLSNTLGFPQLEMLDQHGACRMALTVDPTYGPAIRLFDQQGESPAVFRIDAVNGSDEPALTLIGKDGTEIELSPAAARGAKGGQDQTEPGGRVASPRKPRDILVLPI